MTKALLSDTCIEEGCTSPAKTRGFCGLHYNRRYKAGTLPPHEPCACGAPRPHPNARWCPDCHPSCLEDGCEDDARSRGRCFKHYNIWFRAGGLGHGPCAIPGCGGMGAYAPHSLCSLHYQRMRKYDLTIDELLTIVAGTPCAVCGETADGVDHSHATGEKRGFLCRGCNFGLGYFKDSPDLLRAAAAYLEQPPLAGEVA